MTGFYRRVSDFELVIHVRVTPKSAKDAVEGVETRADGRSHVKVRVRAEPEDGKANAAVCRLLARHFGISASAVRVVSGETSRMKAIALMGEADALADVLAQFGKRG